MAWDTAQISTVEDLIRFLPAANDANFTDDFLQGCVEDAQEEVYDDLSKIVDWDNIEALTEVPRVIKRLGIYKSCEICIIRGWRNDDAALVPDDLTDTILKSFMKKYTALLDQVKSGDIHILDSGNELLEADEVRTLGPGRII